MCLRADLIRADGGAVLVGGSPPRALRLAPRARRLLDTDRLTVTDQVSATLARRLLDGNLAEPVLDHIPPPRGELTVVVPVRDRPKQLDRCLAALTGLPVIVVDDASQDPDAIAAVARRHGARVERLTVNAGPAGARNAGLALVSTPLVAFVDSDVVVTAETLLNLGRHFADPRVALVGPTVAGESRSRRPRWFERYDAAASSLDLGPTGGQVRPDAAVSWLPSACLVGRVALLGDGFASDMRVAEDVDLVWRLVASGLIVRYDPGQRARHDTRKTVRGWLGRKFLYGTGGAHLGIRHGDSIAPASLTALTATGAAAVLVRRRWSLPVAAATVALTTRAVRGILPLERDATLVAARLALRGLGWAMRQESALLLRHWWPLALLGAVTSRSVRRAVGTALLVDLVVFRRERTGVGVPTILLARRLDDLAYGAGLWWGAVRLRDFHCLTVRRPRGSARRGPR